MVHGGVITRVATRTQEPFAGCVPLLRVATRRATSQRMETGTVIDVPKLRRAILDHMSATGKSRRAISLEASDNKNPDLVRDIFRVDKRMPLFSTVSALAGVLGKSPWEFVQGDMGWSPAHATGWMTVKGDVEAGVFREQTEWPLDDWYEIEVQPSDVPGEHTGLVVRGRSMDRIFPPGTELRVAPLIGTGIEFEDGDYAIVERRKSGLVEVTCKRLRSVPEGWELVAESTLPEFKHPISIGKPIEGAEGEMFFKESLFDDEVRVRALVVDAYLPLRKRRRRAYHLPSDHT